MGKEEEKYPWAIILLEVPSLSQVFSWEKKYGTYKERKRGYFCIDLIFCLSSSKCDQDISVILSIWPCTHAQILTDLLHTDPKQAQIKGRLFAHVKAYSALRL